MLLEKQLHPKRASQRNGKGEASGLIKPGSSILIECYKGARDAIGLPLDSLLVVCNLSCVPFVVVGFNQATKTIRSKFGFAK